MPALGPGCDRRAISFSITNVPSWTFVPTTENRADHEDASSNGFALRIDSDRRWYDVSVGQCSEIAIKSRKKSEPNA
jgi:hypothetical protein